MITKFFPPVLWVIFVCVGVRVNVMCQEVRRRPDWPLLNQAE